MTNTRSEESTVDHGLSAEVELNQNKNEVCIILYISAIFVVVAKCSFMTYFYYYSWGSCR